MITQKRIVLSFTTAIILVNNTQANNSINLNKLTVTAQKVEENIQEVPISISLFDELAIEDRKIESVKDIAPYTANFALFDKSAQLSTPSIRGISQPINDAPSSSVSMIIDGVPIFNPDGFDSVLMDIERIEVLKGPQGTLYGKDTQAGAINIITKKPSNELKAKAELELGSDNKKEYSASISGPIIKDKFYFSLAGKHYEKDGFIKNTILGGNKNDKEYDYGKLQFRYTPNENLEISLISSKRKSNHGDIDLLYTPTPNKKETTTTTQGHDKSSVQSHALKIAYDTNNYLLESITSHRKINKDLLQSWIYPPMYNFDLIRDNKYKRLSQEFRLSKKSDSFNWIVGLYGDKDDDLNNYSYEYPTFSYPVEQKIDNDSLGLFFHSDYNITDKLSLISGIRYDKENKSIKQKSTNLNLDISNNEISPKVSIKYQKDRNNMFYSTISKGYRSGGFNVRTGPTYPKKYDKESLINYEIGAKNILFNNKLIINSTIFYMDIDDMQVNIYPDSSYNSYVSNAAKGKSKGFEVELNARLSNTLELFGSYGYANVTFENYKDAKGNYSGNNNTYAPKYNYNLGLQYRDDKGYFARVDLNGYGKTYFDRENKNERDSYNLINAKLGYETQNYDIYFYGKNIFDKNYDSINIYGNSTVVYSAPREIGVQLTYRF